MDKLTESYQKLENTCSLHYREHTLPEICYLSLLKNSVGSFYLETPEPWNYCKGTTLILHGTASSHREVDRTALLVRVSKSENRKPRQFLTVQRLVFGDYHYLTTLLSWGQTQYIGRIGLVKYLQTSLQVRRPLVDGDL